MHEPVYAEPLEKYKEQVKLCAACKLPNTQEWIFCAWCDTGGEG